MSSSSRRGFTLIELLIVISIIVILAGSLLVVIPVIQEAARRARTRTTVTQTGTALSMMMVDGSSFSAVEHPLAGSAVPASGRRPLFYRQGGGTVSRTGEALEALDIGYVASGSQGRVLLPSDRFGGVLGEGDLPLLYGLEREAIGILGTHHDAVTRIRRVPSPDGPHDRDNDGVSDPPYEHPNYNDMQYLEPPPTTTIDSVEDAQTTIVSSVFAANTLEELIANESLNAPPENEGVLILDDRVWHSDDPGDQYDMLQTGSVVGLSSNDWRGYRIRGLAIYDAWGSEILMMITAENQIRLTSAGSDRVFRYDPGPNNVYDTNAYEDTPQGDDVDARGDNISNISAPGE